MSAFTHTAHCTAQSKVRTGKANGGEGRPGEGRQDDVRRGRALRERERIEETGEGKKERMDDGAW